MNKLKCKKKIRDYIYKYNAISMLEFLVDYANINTQLDVLRKVTHKNLKFFNFDNVTTVSFEDIDAFDISNGDVLLVYDYKHHIGAYRNPIRLNSNKYKKKIM